MSKKISSTQKPSVNRIGLGWLPDLPDYRDKLYSAISKAPITLPASVDLRQLCSPVENQGKIGSCTANALVGALEFLEKKDKRKYINLSRLFVYYNERVIEHSVKEDAGAIIRDGIKTLVKQGVCSETKWPYKKSNLFSKPVAACYSEALDHQVASYHRILSLDEMRQCLAEGYPFVFGFTVYSGFFSDEVTKTGVLNMPKPDETYEGGHAVVAVGYNDTQKTFLVRNSWGKSWGMEGYFTMPYEYLSSRDYSDDFWTIRAAENF
jgi:C1A family cysteine protease